MAKIARKTQKIFGSTAGFQQIAQFGSLAASAPVFTTDPDVIQALSNYLQGWYAAVIGANSPAIEDMNAVLFLYAYQLAYMMQEGVAEWDAGTTYYTGSLVNDGSGVLYISLTNNNTGNLLTDFANWGYYGGLTTNINPQNITVVSGKTYFYPTYIIPVGVTWTVNTGGYLTSTGPTIINGTLIVNGTSRTL